MTWTSNKAYFATKSAALGLTVGLALAFAISAGAKPRDPCPQARCATIAHDMRALQGRLRKAHSHSQGTKLRARLQRLREIRRTVCRQ